jgi:hypothetical protein
MFQKYDTFGKVVILPRKNPEKAGKSSIGTQAGQPKNRTLMGPTQVPIQRAKKKRQKQSCPRA